MYKSINHKLLKKITVLFLLTTLFVVTKIKASDTVGTTIEVTEDAINLFIIEQYNKLGFQNGISGSVNGVTYDITLLVPNVKLLTNQAKVTFGFKIESNVFNGIIEFEDELSFQVPSISELTVQGISQAFANGVNSLNINQNLKDVIISAWDGLQLEVYPMKLAKTIEDSEWLVERAINVVDPYFSVDFNVVTGKLRLGLNTYLEGNEYFRAGLFPKIAPFCDLKIQSGSRVEVKEFRLYTSDAKYIEGRTNLGTCPKNGELTIWLNHQFSFAYFMVRILFKKSNTFYLRTYQCVPNGVFDGGYDNLN